MTSSGACAQATACQQASRLAPITLPDTNFSELLGSYLDQLVVRICRTPLLTVRLIRTENAFLDLAQARLALYQQRSGYLAELFPSCGYDDDDLRSYVFAAYVDTRVVGSVRLTPAPFEVSRYLSPSVLRQFLLPLASSDVLEISRLVTDRTAGIPNLGAALAAYAGATCAMTTHYKYYIGYARPTVRNKRLPFAMSADTLSFNIEARGAHSYELFKGSFLDDFKLLVQRHSDPLVELLGLNKASAKSQPSCMEQA